MVYFFLEATVQYCNMLYMAYGIFLHVYVEQEAKTQQPREAYQKTIIALTKSIEF